MVAITQSTELFAQVPVDNEQIVSNPAPWTLPRNPTPQKQREHHLSSSLDSSSSSSETDEEPPPKRPQKKRDGKKERSSAAKELARPPANEWHHNLVPLNKLASLSTSQISKLDDVNEVDDQIRDFTPEIDDINLPFQSEGLAKKVPAGAKFGNWVISRVAWQVLRSTICAEPWDAWVAWQVLRSTIGAEPWDVSLVWSTTRLKQTTSQITWPELLMLQCWFTVRG